MELFAAFRVSDFFWGVSRAFSLRRLRLLKLHSDQLRGFGAEKVSEVSGAGGGVWDRLEGVSWCGCGDRRCDIVERLRIVYT